MRTTCAEVRVLYEARNQLVLNKVMLLIQVLLRIVSVAELVSMGVPPGGMIKVFNQSHAL